VSEYGSSFAQSKSSAPLIFAETDDDQVLYFSSDKRFLEWAYKRFSYEDNTRAIFYKRIGNKSLKAVQQETGRSYCAISFQIEEDPKETVHIELFDEECPCLARNFLELLGRTEFNGNPVHRVKKGAWIQAGDLVDGSGLHSKAAEGSFIRHESYKIPHDRGGLVGMASQGKDTNGSQFYITLREMPFLDGRSVIIGRVISGMRVIHKISKLPTRNERPLAKVGVYACPEHSFQGSIQDKVDSKETGAATAIQSLFKGRKDREKVNNLKVNYDAKDDLGR